MKIAFLVPYSKKYFYQKGGVSDLSVKGKDIWFFKYIPDRSIEVDIIGCLASFTYKKRVPLVIVQILSFFPLARKYDVVISSGFMNGIFFSAIRKLIRVKKFIHIILDTRAIGALKPHKTIILRIARYLLSSVDGVICFSQNHKYFWEKYLGFSGKVISAPWPMEANLKSIYPVVGDYIFSGGSTKRDWKTLISAAEKINSKFIIAAGKDSASGKYGLEDINIPKNIKVLFDIPSKQYRKLISKALFAIIPLKNVLTDVGWETLTQAMTMGKVVIVTKIPPLEHYIEDGKTGLFVEPNNSEDFREKILFLLQNPQEIERIGKNAKEKMEESKSGRKITAEKLWLMLQKIIINKNVPK
mgnify:CR=1 FL=1